MGSLPLEIPFEIIDDSHIRIWRWEDAPTCLREEVKKPARFLVYVPASFNFSAHTWPFSAESLCDAGDGAIVLSTNRP